MAASSFLDRVQMTVSTVGTGSPLTLNVAYAANANTMANANAVNGATYTYVLTEGNNFEIGRGAYNSSTGTITRTAIINSMVGGVSGTSPINLLGGGVLAIDIAAEDLALFLSGAGFTLTGAANWATAVTVASATTPAIGAAASNVITMSGIVTVTGFDTIAAGAERIIKHTGAHILTHNATSLILLGAANITTAAGDISRWISEGSGNWRMLEFQRATSSPDAALYALLGASNTFTARQSIPAIQSGRTDKGNSGTATQTIDVSAAGKQKITVTGSFTVAFSNWPASGTYGEVDLELAGNGTAYTVTWPTIHWLKGDGTNATTFPSAVTLYCTTSTVGSNDVIVWTSDGGTTLYGVAA